MSLRQRRAAFGWTPDRYPQSIDELTPSALATTVAHVFEELHVGASLWNGGDGWAPLHVEPSITDFEYEHAVEFDRGSYNNRSFAEAMRQGKLARREHAGFSDLWLPLSSDGKNGVVLVTGPFATKRLSSGDILEHWYGLTGRRGDVADPEFSAYLRAALDVLLLEPEMALRFEQLLERLAALLMGAADAHRLARETNALRIELAKARIADHSWRAVQTMVDDRFPRSWHSMGKLYDLFSLGLESAPDQALVALCVNLRESGDPVDEAVRRDALQRRSVALARSTGDMISGRVGTHGILFLSAESGSLQRKRQKLIAFSERVSALARREFGMGLHFGCGTISDLEPLSRAYQRALAAAEGALASGTRLVIAEAGKARTLSSLRELRQELGRVLEGPPGSLGPKFDHYLEAVALKCGNRIEAARGHLEAGFERVAEPLQAAGILEQKSFSALCETLEREQDEANTLSDLFATYRRAIKDVSEVLMRPVPARRERGLRTALEYMRRHYAESLKLEQVAKVAGITPDYFSKLFKEREHTTFEHHLRRLRLERSKQLLADTGIGIGRVAELSGFASQQYFCRVFRSETRLTPRAYRLEVQPQARRSAKKTRQSPKS